MRAPCGDECTCRLRSMADLFKNKLPSFLWSINKILTVIELLFSQNSGAPNDGNLPNALKCCFRLSGVLLKLCRLILGCAIKFLSVRFF